VHASSAASLLEDHIRLRAFLSTAGLEEFTEK